MGSSIGAGYGADMLQEVLKRKLLEQAQHAQEQQFAAKLSEDARQSNMQNEVSRGNLAAVNRRTDEDVRQFDAQAPLRIANVGRISAETGELQRRPQAEQQQRDFTTGRDKTQHGYQMEEVGVQGAQRMREIGAQGANALKVANVSHPDPNSVAATQKEQNEVQDSLALIDQISQDKSLPNAVGLADQYVGGLINLDPEGVKRFGSLHDQLAGKMQLAQAGKLKGQGQISDKERAMLAAAATALNRGLNEKDYRAELQKVRDQFQRMLTGPRVQPAATAPPDYRKKYDY